MISTWFTRHPNDQERFYEAIDNLKVTFDGRVSEDALRDALKRYRDENPATLDGPISDATIESFVQDAMAILGYVNSQGPVYDHRA